MSGSKSSSRRANKTRKQEIDDTIEHLSQEVSKLNDFVFKSELEFSLMTAKLKREKVKALAAVAKSQVLLADMEILIAESELLSDLQKLKNNNKELKEAKSQQKCDDGIPVSRKSKFKSSLAPSTEAPNPKRRKRSSASISSIDTVIIETLPDNHVESTSSLQSCVILPKTESPAELEVSLPSSLKAAFNISYEETENQTHRKSLEKKDLKGKSSSASKNDSLKTKTVADIKKSSLGPKSDNCKDLDGTPKSSRSKCVPSTSTYIPIRHNMPMIITQAKHSYRAEPSTSSNRYVPAADRKTVS